MTAITLIKMNPYQLDKFIYRKLSKRKLKNVKSNSLHLIKTISNK